MTSFERRRIRRPALDETALHELALAYVGRFSTTRAKLAQYLHRKSRERGWAGRDERSAIEDLVERFSGAGLVDDAAYALAKAGVLERRGYGAGRLRQQLRAAGVGDSEGAPALDLAAAASVCSALRFAERRRFGPFAEEIADPRTRQRQVAAMVRAGHPLGLALAIVRCPPGEHPDPEELSAET